MVKKLPLIISAGVAAALLFSSGCANSGSGNSGRRVVQEPSARTLNYRDVRRQEDAMMRKVGQTGNFDLASTIYFGCALANTYSSGNRSARDQRGFQECLIERGYFQVR